MGKRGMAVNSFPTAPLLFTNAPVRMRWDSKHPEPGSKFYRLPEYIQYLFALSTSPFMIGRAQQPGSGGRVMKAALHRFTSLSFALSVAAGLAALPGSALADEPAATYTTSLLDAMLRPSAEAEDANLKLPLRLEDEIELREAHMISLSDFLPQGRL